MTDELDQRVIEMKRLNAELERRVAECTAQLVIARSALEQEVAKRLWAEEELTKANRRLHHQAMRDALTGLYNRRYFEESFERELSRARRGGELLGLMIIDIDHFKLCNDTFGHPAGDAVLCAVAKFMQLQTRGEDILCRYGGEEFVLVQAQASADAVLQRAETFRQGVQALEIEHDGRRVGPVTLSIGIAIFPDHAADGQALLHAADQALYRAKQGGRNRVEMCAPNIST